MNPIVEEIVCRLDEDIKEEWDERAGIIQFDAGIPRSEAEALALICILRRHPDVLNPRKKENLI